MSYLKGTKSTKEAKTIQTLEVVRSMEIASGVFSLMLRYPEGKEPSSVKPGQFVGLYPADSSMLLPRPISICEWDARERILRLVYRTVGKGTEEFSELQEGDSVCVLGILGNGYDLSLLAGKKVLLLGGGIGAPPMLGLAEAIRDCNRNNRSPILSDSFSLPAASSGSPKGTKNAKEETEQLITAVMGYRTNDLFLTEEFRKVSWLVIATDDGTAGFHGNAVAAAEALGGHDKEQPFDVICACGPLPMLRGVKRLSLEWHIPAFLSLEERMACGVGACLGCVVKTTGKDAHSQVNNARVCMEGPVFLAEDVEL